MIEITNIFLTLVLFLLICSAPLSVEWSRKNINSNITSSFDVLSINLLINLSLLFLISFLDVNYSIFFILFIIILIFFNIINFSKQKYFFKFKNRFLLLFFIFINLLIFFNIAAEPTLAWDGLENWYFKAQIFFNNGNFFDLRDVNGLNYYPHYGTFLWGFFWKNSFLQYEYFGRLIYVFIYLLSIFSISDVLKKDNFVKIIFSSILILLTFDDFLFRGYQELLIFSFLIFSSKYFYFYILEQKKNNLIISFCFLNFLPWVKNEGYLYVLIFTLSLLFIINKFVKKKEISIFIILSLLLVITKTFIFSKYINTNLTHGVDLNFKYSLIELTNFFSTFFVGLLIAIFKYKIWFLILASLFLLKKPLSRNKKNLTVLNFFYINFSLYFLVVLAIYYSFIGNGLGIEWWIDNSLDRLLYGISGFFIILLPITLNKSKL